MCVLGPWQARGGGKKESCAVLTSPCAAPVQAAEAGAVAEAGQQFSVLWDQNIKTSL